MMGVLRGMRLQAVAMDNRLIAIRICPQGTPAWSPLQIKFLTSTALGTGYTANQTYVVPGANSSSPVPNADPRESEDCLFLDVFVPEKVMSKVGQGYAPLTPVLVWIYVSDAGFITIVRLANLIAGRRIYTRKQEH
jgi:hypothetical protein